MTKTKLNSGYVDCACRDCVEIAITSGGPALCWECEEAGCSAEGTDECLRSDAYGQDEGPESDELIQEINSLLAQAVWVAS